MDQSNKKIMFTWQGVLEILNGSPKCTSIVVLEWSKFTTYPIYQSTIKDTILDSSVDN